jgi:hypothetical protein
MTASLPAALQDVFARFITTEYTTIDRYGQPIAWPVTPYYTPGGATIDVTTGLGYPKKANDARRNPSVALLFSDPTGSGLSDPPTVLVQGTADVDARDLEANRARYARECVAKLPAMKSMLPPEPLQQFASWYFTRIYVHVRPERVYSWPSEDPSAEPQLYTSHVEEHRSGHSEEPPVAHAAATGGAIAWDDRIAELGVNYRRAVVALVGPDGFPFAARVRVEPDAAAGLIRLTELPVGAPLEPGRACLVAHDHAPDFAWQRNFQVRGDLVADGNGWALVPRRLVGGLELPPGSALARIRLNAAKAIRYRRIAKRELRRLAAGEVR